MVFAAPDIKDESSNIENDVLISMPTTEELGTESEKEKIIDQTKEYLADSKNKIKLHDLMVREIRRVIQNIKKVDLSVNISFSKDEFEKRLAIYEENTLQLRLINSCIGYWSEGAHSDVLIKPHVRLFDLLEHSGGTKAWLALRFYPSILMLYSAGISAIASPDYA